MGTNDRANRQVILVLQAVYTNTVVETLYLKYGLTGFVKGQ